MSAPASRPRIPLISARSLPPLDPSFANFIAYCSYDDVLKVCSAHASSSVQERAEAVSKFCEEKQKEYFERKVVSEVDDEDEDGDEEDEDEDEELLDYDIDEQISTEDDQESSKKGMTEIQKEAISYSNELILVIDKTAPEEMKEALCKNKDKKSSEVMDGGNYAKKTGEISKLLGHGKRHAHSVDPEVSVEGEQEHKKARMAERSRNMGEDVGAGETMVSI